MKRVSVVYSTEVQGKMDSQTWNKGLNIALRFGCNFQTKLVFRSEGAWKDTCRYSTVLDLCRERFCTCFRVTIAYSLAETMLSSVPSDTRLEIKGYAKGSSIPICSLIILFSGEDGKIR